jgi:hypothetical protein
VFSNYPKLPNSDSSDSNQNQNLLWPLFGGDEHPDLPAVGFDPRNDAGPSAQVMPEQNLLIESVQVANGTIEGKEKPWNVVNQTILHDVI